MPIADSFAVNGGVEDSTTNWQGRGDASISRTTRINHEGNASLLVTGRNAEWHGITFDLGTLTVSNEYDVKVWVRLQEGEPTETLKLTAKKFDDSDTSTFLEYTEVATAEVNSDEWVLLEGLYTPDGNFEHFIVEGFPNTNFASFYVDAFSITGDRDPTVITPPTGDGLKSYTDMPIGIAVALSGPANLLGSTGHQKLVNDNFSEITAENDMKMNSYNENTFVGTSADNMIAWAAARNINVHGHTLVWHFPTQLPSWANNPPSDFKARYRAHVTGVAEQYVSRVISWDVVNEALYDPADSEGGDQNGYRNSVFYQQYGGPEYIVEAFKLARQADPGADLYYNDFNIENNLEKTDNLIKLIQYLRNEGAPIDGIGFQMHVLNDFPSLANIKASWQKVLDADPNLKIKLTELDVRINNFYDGNDSNDLDTCGPGCPGLDAQKARYKSIIKAYYEVVPENRRSGITVWGVLDPDSYAASFPDWPLLWFGNFQAKPAYDGFEEALNESE